MKISILGAGAMGSLVGAHLKKGGGEVYFVDVYAQHIEAIREHGLIMELEGEPEPTTVFMDGAATSGSEVGECDAVVILVKCNEIAEAVSANRSLFSKDTIVITLQNGVGGSEVLNDYFDEDHLGRGVLKSSANILAPGRILGRVRFENSPKGIYFSPVNPNSPLRPRFDALEKLWCDGGMPAECTDRAEEYIWNKLVDNVMYNGIAALLHLGNEDSAGHEDGWQLMRELAREACEVAQAKGFDLRLDDYWKDRSGRQYDRSRVKTMHYVSALFDSFQKHRTEIDFINGAVVKEGRKLGVPTPYNETIWRLVRVMQDNYDNKFSPE